MHVSTQRSKIPRICLMSEAQTSLLRDTKFSVRHSTRIGREKPGYELTAFQPIEGPPHARERKPATEES